MLWGDWKKTEEVLAEFENLTKDTLNLSIDWTFIPLADYREKLPLMMSTGEELDICFDAEWITLKTNIANGLYNELDSYFEDASNKGLQTFDKDMVQANRYSGKIYAIPFMETYVDTSCIFYRGDLREKYGMEPFTSDADVIAFFDKVLAEEEGMMPIALDARRGWREFGYNAYQKAEKNIFGVGTEGCALDVLLSDDHSQALDAMLVLNWGYGGEAEEAYADWPIDKDFHLYNNLNHVSLTKYVETDILLQSDRTGVYVAGKAAATEGTLANMADWNLRLKASVPDAWTEFYATIPAQREQAKGKSATTFKAGNFMAFPYQSKKLDRSIAFINWVHESKENHDLFAHGIEGTHWIAVGDDQYDLPAGVDASNNNTAFPYQLTWNANYMRLPVGTSEAIINQMAWEKDPSSFYVSPMTGFNFDPTPVATELAKVGALDDDIVNIIYCGQVDDPEAMLVDYYNKCMAQGLDAIKAEVLKQLNVHLATK